MPIDSWLYYTLAATVIWTLNNFLDKIIVSRYRIPVISFVILANLTSVFPLLASFLFTDLSSFTSYDLALSLINGLLLGFSTLVYVKALEKSDAPTVITLIQLTPIFVLILETLIYRKIFEPITYFGIALVLLGTLVVVRDWDNDHQKRLLHLTFSPAILLGIGFSVIWATSITLQEEITQRQPVANVFCLAKIGEVLLALAFLAVPRWRNSFALIDKPVFRKALWANLAGEALNGIALACLMLAIAVGSMSLVTTVSASQPVFSLLMILGINAVKTNLIPDEGSHRNIKLKLFGMAAVFLGIYFVS